MSIDIRPEIRAKVEAGIAFLDSTIAYAWRSHIDLAYLDLADGTDCVLGQLGGSNGGEFDHMLPALGLTLDQAAELGFLSTEWATAEGHDRAYAELTEAWRQALNAV